jgi:hypothetical protein
MKKIDRMLITLLTVGIWVCIFVFLFSPNLTKARDPFTDKDDFEMQQDDFFKDNEIMTDGYTLNGDVTIHTPLGDRDSGRMNCTVVIRK